MSRALHGLTRSLINNMVVGVKEGYEKRLKSSVSVTVGQSRELNWHCELALPMKSRKPSPPDLMLPAPTKTMSLLKAVINSKSDSLQQKFERSANRNLTKEKGFATTVNT